MRVSPHRLFIPLLISFSLTGVGVILIYFLNKKNEEDEQKNKNNKNEQNLIEIRIPHEFVPVIIGRGGLVIQDLQKTTNTKISFKEENDIDSLERTCIITGNNKNIKLAEEKIKCILNNQPIIETYETWIPQRTITRIIEKGGLILNQIQNLSNAKIITENSSTSINSDAKKRIIIKGTAEQIANALLQIEDKVREDNEARIKTENNILTRVPRIKTSPVATSENISKDTDYSKEIFGNQGNEGLMEVFVCAIDNPSQFYIQVISPTNIKLDDLIKEMTEYYELEENREFHTLKEITVGQIVAAKFSVDNKWYRAEIVTDLGDKLYDAYFVDFGDRDKIGSECLLELRTDFLSLRLQAIECSLAGVKPRDGEWSVEAIESFSQMCALAKWQPRIAKIRGYKERVFCYGPSRREGSPIPCVELYEKIDEQLINIGKELIKQELACAENEPWSAASSTLSLSWRDSRAKSPEAAALANGSSTPRTIEEIDLTLNSPRWKPSKDIETIDLTTPKNESNTASRSFIENEKNSPITSNGTGNKSSNKSLPSNPFKPNKPTIVRNIIPAGYENEFSDDSDAMEYY